MAKQTYTDPTGDTVSAKWVPAYDKLRDQIAERIAKPWADEEARLAKLKSATIADIEKLVEAAEKTAGVSLGGAKGNLQFRSFDGSITISMDRQYRTEFDERLQLAQQLITEAVKEMRESIIVTDAATAKARQNIEDLGVVATGAFQPRKNGNLDRQRIRDLRKMPVRHQKWQQAMAIIGICERTVAFRDYIRVAVRLAPDAKPQPITLDIASL